MNSPAGLPCAIRAVGTNKTAQDNFRRRFMYFLVMFTKANLLWFRRAIQYDYAGYCAILKRGGEQVGVRAFGLDPLHTFHNMTAKCAEHAQLKTRCNGDIATR